jgi:hypothetical protein
MIDERMRNWSGAEFEAEAQRLADELVRLPLSRELVDVAIANARETKRLRDEEELAEELAELNEDEPA